MLFCDIITTETFKFMEYVTVGQLLVIGYESVLYKWNSYHIHQEVNSIFTLCKIVILRYVTVQ